MESKKTLYKTIAIVVIILSIIGVNKYNNYKEERLTIERNERRAKQRIMFMFGFDNYANDYKIDEPSDKDSYKEEFLRDENLPMLLLRFKEKMSTDYPDIGYGSKYEEITIERLETEYREILEEIWAMNEKFKENYSDNERIYNIVISESVRMCKDGIWIGDGASKVAEDSAIALTRKAKVGCMEFFGIDRYYNDYMLNGYKEEVFERFLADERLPIFIGYMKEYMDVNYPDAGYGSKYKEITMERLTKEYEEVYQELVDMTVGLEEMYPELKELVDKTGIMEVIWIRINSDIEEQLELKEY